MEQNTAQTEPLRFPERLRELLALLGIDIFAGLLYNIYK